MNISELARHLEAECYLPDGKDGFLTGVATLQKSEAGKVSFVENMDVKFDNLACRAGALIVSQKLDNCLIPQIIHKNPRYAFVNTLKLFYRPEYDVEGVSEKAVVSEKAKLGNNVTVYPFAYIGPNCDIGDNVVIFPFSYIGSGSKIGNNCIIKAHVTIESNSELGERVIVHSGVVVGADGFGYMPTPAGILKIPQIGRAVLEDDVEIGSLSNVHKGAIDETRIKRGSKLDSLVHVAHNVVLGEDCMLCGQTGIAGSAKIGDRLVTAGQTAINGHIEVGDDVTLGARGVIEATLKEKGSYLGFPARPATTHWREQSHIKLLPKMRAEIRELKLQVEKLSKLLQD